MERDASSLERGKSPRKDHETKRYRGKENFLQGHLELMESN